MKIPFIIYADTESMLEKIHTCDTNLTKSFTSKTKNIKLVVLHYSHTVHLIATKASKIST